MSSFGRTRGAKGRGFQGVIWRAVFDFLMWLDHHLLGEVSGGLSTCSSRKKIAGAHRMRGTQHQNLERGPFEVLKTFTRDDLFLLSSLDEG